MNFIKLMAILKDGERKVVWIKASSIRLVTDNPSGLEVYITKSFSVVVECTIEQLNNLLWQAKLRSKNSLENLEE